jgi:hypothetical protein
MQVQGTATTQASGGAGCCRRSGVTVGLFPPCRFVETPNVTASAWTQARTPCTSSSPHSLYGEMLSGESTAQLSENSSDAAEDAASLATLPTSP